MSLQAANRLLKILEEPPSYLVFLLCTTGISDLLPTIVSRSQVLRALPSNDQQISSAKADKTQLITAGYTHSDACYLAPIIQGKKELLSTLLAQHQDVRELRRAAREKAINSIPRDLAAAIIAADLSNTCIITAIERHEAMIALIERIVQGEKVPIVTAVPILAKEGREAAGYFLRNLLYWCRELLRCKLSLSVSDAEEEVELKKFVSRIQLAALIETMRALTELWRAIGSNVSVEGILLASLIKLGELCDN
jgi:DNA polymerase III gamma/tau subunit